MASQTTSLDSPDPLSKYLAYLAGLCVSVAGLLGANHLSGAIWFAALAGVLFTGVFCLERRSRAWVKAAILAAALLAFGGSAFLASHTGKPGPPPVVAAPASQPSQTLTTNSAETHGDNAPAIVGSGNTVTSTQSSDPSRHPAKRGPR